MYHNQKNFDWTRVKQKGLDFANVFQQLCRHKNQTSSVVVPAVIQT